MDIGNCTNTTAGASCDLAGRGGGTDLSVRCWGLLHLQAVLGWEWKHVRVMRGEGESDYGDLCAPFYTWDPRNAWRALPGLVVALLFYAVRCDAV